MITELLLIAATGIIDPMDMSGNEMYPSGTKECDKYPRYSPPASKMATLSLPKSIIAENGDIITSGHYLTALSVSGQEILVFEGHKELYTLKITASEILEKPRKISTAEFLSDDSGESIVILTQGRLRVIAKVTLYSEN